ncbi:predicted protein [Uncinocarpus reesii 1704]|uniref:Uncharacterized protein n=1 Tax=Uncinocarpus reesii (strain UAMH 1704) TaxID=336963 RepID=C4JHJ1_UNCRE|nr:uncharacterized protein UREG_01354 [Uncinocarpus reesii 1704]EEP76505.1 predicted protein [Uncinocarpus reesii 1704]
MPLIPVPPTRAVEFIYANDPPMLYDTDDATTAHCARCRSNLFLGTQKWITLFPNTGRPMTIFALFELEYAEEKVCCFRCGDEIGFRSPVDGHPGKYDYIWTCSKIQLKDVYHKMDVSPLFGEENEDEGLRVRGLSKCQLPSGLVEPPAPASKTPIPSERKLLGATTPEINVSATVTELCQTVRELQSQIRLFSAAPSQTSTGKPDSFELVAIALKELQFKTAEVAKLTSENVALSLRIKDLEERLNMGNVKPTIPPNAPPRAGTEVASHGSLGHSLLPQPLQTSNSLNESRNGSHMPNNPALEIGTVSVADAKGAQQSHELHVNAVERREGDDGIGGQQVSAGNPNQENGQPMHPVNHAAHQRETEQAANPPDVGYIGRRKRAAEKRESQATRGRGSKKQRLEPQSPKRGAKVPKGPSRRPPKPSGNVAPPVPGLSQPQYQVGVAKGPDDYLPPDSRYHTNERIRPIATGPRGGRGAKSSRGGFRGSSQVHIATFPNAAPPGFPQRVKPTHLRFHKDNENSGSPHGDRERLDDGRDDYSFSNSRFSFGSRQLQQQGSISAHTRETQPPLQPTHSPVTVKREPDSLPDFHPTRNTELGEPAPHARRPHMTAQDIMSRAAVQREDVMQPGAL